LLLLARKRRSAIFPENGHSMDEYQSPARPSNTITRWLQAMAAMGKKADVPVSVL